MDPFLQKLVAVQECCGDGVQLVFLVLLGLGTFLWEDNHISRHDGPELAVIGGLATLADGFGFIERLRISIEAEFGTLPENSFIWALWLVYGSPSDFAKNLALGATAAGIGWGAALLTNRKRTDD